MTFITFLTYYFSLGLFLSIFYFVIMHKGIENWIKTSIEKEKTKKFKFVTQLKNINGIDDYLNNFILFSMVLPIIPLIFIVGDMLD